MPPIARFPRPAVFFALLTAAGLTAGCATPEFESRWQTVPPVIDGRAGEWEGLLHPVAKGEARIGVMNDGEYLSLALVTADDEVKRMVLRSGLIVWFDTAGASEKRFGIRYPLSAGFQGERGLGNASPSPSAEEFELCGPGPKDRRRMPFPRSGGIAARIDVEYDTLVYEMRVPLRSSGTNSVGIGAAPRCILGVGIETAAPEQGPRGRSSRPTEGGSGRGGRGGRGGQASGPESSSPLQLEAWMKVRLAAADSAGTGR